MIDGLSTSANSLLDKIQTNLRLTSRKKSVENNINHNHNHINEQELQQNEDEDDDIEEYDDEDEYLNEDSPYNVIKGKLYVACGSNHLLL
jgi:anionic cell wall polymer biosynthesis LytR-Cps2A-Psr (LCP) family protein